MSILEDIRKQANNFVHMTEREAETILKELEDRAQKEFVKSLYDNFIKEATRKSENGVFSYENGSKFINCSVEIPMRFPLYVDTWTKTKTEDEKRAFNLLKSKLNYFLEGFGGFIGFRYNFASISSELTKSGCLKRSFSNTFSLTEAGQAIYNEFLNFTKDEKGVSFCICATISYYSDKAYQTKQIAFPSKETSKNYIQNELKIKKFYIDCKVAC